MANIQMNKALKETFSFLKNSGIGAESAKLNMFRLIPLPILNRFMPLIFNTKWAETVISDHALAVRDEMKMLFNDFILLAEGKGYNLNELKKLSTL